MGNRGSRFTGTEVSTRSLIPKSVKIDFPRFKGTEDPTSWLCRAENFFEIHGILEEEKVRIAFINMEGDAQLWYQLFKEEQGLVTWESFKEGLNIRYGPTQYQDFFGDLTKLKQMGSVRDYQTQFERLLIRVGTLTAIQQVGCFVSGLKESIRTDVQACKPSTLSAAIGLARLYESREQASRRSIPSTTDLKRTPIEKEQNQSRSILPIKKLTPVELKERREKGLCFNCNEKFGPGHRCRKLFLIEGSWTDDEENDVIDKAKSQLLKEKTEMPEISLHAIYGARMPQTMRVRGRIDQQRITILIDSGSTHKFLDDCMAKKLGLYPHHKGKFEVTVANGEKLCSSGRCKDVCILLNGLSIVVDLYLLPSEGCDVVLGAQWLYTLGPII
uniref:Ty3 transposon capsid-like protein domain-containing protein n=1 Tax=Ananas comosus var. bracteatus TaxID=296719 RepID=A0A6V7PYL1_ANACO|nr:unnamed protein product [Ananas comosus var. bracteatus]